MPTACFTGHRKINGHYYNSFNPSPDWLALKNYLNELLHGLMINSVDHYISGLAIGVDLLAAECVDYARTNIGFDVQLTGAMPFPSQAGRWPQPTRQHWDHVCTLCNQVVSVSADPYSPEKMQTRNEWMVNNSHYVIAIWNGIRKGGTWNCITYAQTRGLPILFVQQGQNGWQAVWVSSPYSEIL